MFKNVISPMQAWLLSQGRCVGCGKPLSDKKSKAWETDKKQVTCTCGRIFILDSKKKTYRRALLNEVK